jgi:hypothetical protein
MYLKLAATLRGYGMRLSPGLLRKYASQKRGLPVSRYPVGHQVVTNVFTSDLARCIRYNAADHAAVHMQVFGRNMYEHARLHTAFTEAIKTNGSDIWLVVKAGDPARQHLQRFRAAGVSHRSETVTCSHFFIS